MRRHASANSRFTSQSQSTSSSKLISACTATINAATAAASPTIPKPVLHYKNSDEEVELLPQRVGYLHGHHGAASDTTTAGSRPLVPAHHRPTLSLDCTLNLHHHTGHDSPLSSSPSSPNPPAACALSSNATFTTPAKFMRESAMLRLARISGGLMILLYVWSSSGAMFASASKSAFFNIDSLGKVLRVEDSKVQHQRATSLLQSSSSSHFPETTGSQEQSQKQNHEHQFRSNYRYENSSEESDSQSAARSEQIQKQESIQQLSSPDHAANSSGNEENDVDDENNDECGIYLAPSTIPGAGMGMFTTRSLHKGDHVGNGEVVIPLVELRFYSNEDNGDNLFNPFIHHYWKGTEMGLHGVVSEQRTGEVMAVVPGLDAAINCNLALINVDKSESEYDDGDLHRHSDPLAGAMTSYHATASTVIREIPAGGELFKFYGDRWFAARKEEFGLMPLSEDYPAAQKLVDKFGKLSQQHFPNNDDLQKDLLSLISDIGTDRWESRTMNALPRTLEDVKKASESDIAALHQPQAVRSVEYLREHGKCVDSIRPGPSTLPSHQGGRGAFATRDMAEGRIITGSPLHHVPRKDLMTIFRMEINGTDEATGEEKWLRHLDDVVGYQMMLNYCYGHPESTMLLCPYGPGINYINHNKTLANVKIQWAKDGETGHNDTWLYRRSPENLEWDYTIGLAFDYVATKDIRSGDELFLDYGDEFEQALTEFTAKWKASKSAASSSSSSLQGKYTPAERYNEKFGEALLLTEAEQKLEPYPQNLEIHCHSGVVTKKDHGAFYWETREGGLPCRILERRTSVATNSTTEESLYKVELRIPLDEIGLQHQKDAFTYIQRSDVPRNAIAFFNKPYTTDLFLQNSFRAPIGIPDSMLPGQWRNALRFR